MQKVTLNTTIIASLLFIIWLLLEISIEGTLTKSSTDLILSLQEYNSDTLILTLKVLNLIIPLFPYIILLLTMQRRDSKIDTFYSFTQALLTLVLTSTLKMLFRSSRPFLECNKIRAIVCECSYGNPSFHVGFTTIGYLILLNDLENICKGIMIKIPSKCAKIFYYILGFSFILIEIFIRMYFGTHYYGECVCAFLLAVMVFCTLEFYRRPVRKYLYRKYDMVRRNRLAQIWSMIVPVFVSIVFFLFNSWVIKMKSRDLTETEKRNMSKCSNCHAHNLSRTSNVGLLGAYYIPGMILCISIMSFNKSPRKKNTFTFLKKILRLLFNTFFRLLTVIPMYLIYIWRSEIGKEDIHFFISLMLIFTPSVGFAFPGILYKKCSLEIHTDFIRKGEDPNEDEKKVVMSNYLLNNERTVEWDVSQLKDYGEHMISGNQSVSDEFLVGGTGEGKSSGDKGGV